MRSVTKGLLRTLFIGAGLLAVAGLGVWRLGTASGQATVVRVVAPSSVSPGGDFEVRIEIQNAPPPEAGCPEPTGQVTGEKFCGLASYEWVLKYDPNLVEFKGVTDGEFLTSTGRIPVVCSGPIVGPAPGLEAGNVRWGCATSGHDPSGPSGSGLLTRLTFTAKAQGASPLDLAWVQLSDWAGNFDIPTGRQGACVAIGAGATCVAPTVAPPATPLPPVTPTPGGSPAPTSTPTGPAPTPTPLPPGLEAVPLAAGCNPVTSTYPDDTPIQTVAGAVGPAGNLVSLWRFDVGTWRAFSPQYPQVSDLTEADLLDVVFVCVQGPGDFVRPIV
jgi:hypothetical protein